MMTAQQKGPTAMHWWLELIDILVPWRDEWARRRSSRGPRSSRLWKFTTTITWCQRG